MPEVIATMEFTLDPWLRDQQRLPEDLICTIARWYGWVPDENAYSDGCEVFFGSNYAGRIAIDGSYIKLDRLRQDTGKPVVRINRTGGAI